MDANTSYITGLTGGVMFLLLLVLIIILAVITVSMSLRLSRLTKKYQMFMRGRDGESMESVFADKLANVEKIDNRGEENKEDIEVIKGRIGSSLTHYGIVKYDAFDDVGGKMSFALAMLDDSNTGFILNTIHSRDNCFQYIKEIVNGESYILLSEEEMEALNRAVANKEEEELDGLL
ncbi:MAG: DUF4446 family protein [Candidatus Alectryocaccobium sp.]|jgi:hypothetical protein|nr:DUF4446 family protein [Candidatus Alectryocaccobium sp.]